LTAREKLEDPMDPRKRRSSSPKVALALLLIVGGCAPDAGSGAASEPSVDTGGTAGLAGTGGAPSTGGIASTGGAPMTGGAAPTGGATGSSTGGASNTGADASAGRGGSSGATGGGGNGGTGLPPGVLWFDNFEDGDTKGWVADADDGTNVGSWAVVTDGATKVYKEQNEYSDQSWTVGGDVAWTDQHLETKVEFVSTSNGDAIAYLAVRLTTKDTYYFLEFHANATNGSLKVRKRVSGSTTDLVSSYKTGMPVIVGTWYTIGLSAIGSTITGYFNGAPIGNATDTELTHGGVALGIVDGVAEFDEVKVTSQ
jgi:hypothetical protein